MGFNYSQYGAFKNSSQDVRYGFAYRIAKKIGIKNRYIRFLSGISKNGIVVEIGCGDGHFVKELIKEGYVNVIGVEPSETYNFVIGAESLKKNNAFDYLSTCHTESIAAIIALDVFEHIPIDALRVLLDLMYDRLLPGGIVVFRVPNVGSPLGLFNYFGDLSHVTPLNEISIRQLCHETRFVLNGLYPEPFAFPRSVDVLIGISIWSCYKWFLLRLWCAFGIKPSILTPNLVCRLEKYSESKV